MNFCGIRSSDKTASPLGTLLSSAISAKSCIFLPDECLETTDWTYLIEVIPITLMPRSLACIAISTGTALRPETETMIKTSPDLIGLWSSITLA